MTKILSMSGVHKRFGAVHALRGVSLSVEQGEIHALIGENGAGKSTLMKILSGAYIPDEGEIRFGENPFRISSPGDARHAQERSLETGFPAALLSMLTCPTWCRASESGMLM